MGENTITFSAGPQEGTISVQPKPPYTDLNVTVVDNDPGALQQWNTIAPAAGKTAVVTVPVETPGDMARVRVCCNYRANDKGEGWDLEVSFDDGKTFKKAGRAEGPARHGCVSAVAEAPAGVRKALVRYSGVQKSGLIIFRLRVDADYKEPAGAFAPVKVTYEWEENGQAKNDVHIAKSEKDVYKINCAAKPVMKAITMELAE
jgi:hypothetical protein